MKKKTFYRDGVLYYQDKVLITQQALALKGAGAVDNVLAACALVSSWHDDISTWRKTLQRFTGLAHRCETVFKDQRCTWYNDSKGTNIGAMLKAVEFVAGQHQSLVLLLGGVSKGACFAELAAYFPQQISCVITFGRDGEAIAGALGDSIPTKYYATLQAAISAIACLKETLSFDAVLLSPACASFDQFSNYQHRGQVFTDLVKELHHA